jgi:hypothetical protein
MPHPRTASHQPVAHLTRLKRASSTIGERSWSPHKRAFFGLVILAPRGSLNNEAGGEAEYDLAVSMQVQKPAGPAGGLAD